MSNISRHQAGTQIAGQKIGGQFKATERTQAAAFPGSVDPDWGSLNLSVGSRTPWGEADQVENVAPGIAIVHTPSHGGIKLSPQRNKMVPAPLRNSNGWYEEDCEQHIACFTFPDELAYGEGADYTRESAREGVKEWYPDQWEAATGEKVTAEESRIVAEREWREAHQGVPHAHSARSSVTNPDMVVLSARPVTGEDRWDEYLVPREEYKAASSLGFAIDPKRHPLLPPAEPEPTGRPDLQTYDLSDRVAALREGSREQMSVKKDLGQLWRDPKTNHVRSLQDIIAQEGAVELTTYFGDTGKPTYALIGKDSSSYRISKSTRDFLAQSIPDSTSKSSELRAAAQRARSAAYKLNEHGWGSRSLDDVRRAKELRLKAERLEAEASAARTAEIEADIAMNGTYEERAARRERIMAERERAARVQD